MKTIREVIAVLNDEIEATGPQTGMFTAHVIRKIQADALRHAAEIATDGKIWESAEQLRTRVAIRDAILTKAKTIEP